MGFIYRLTDLTDKEKKYVGIIHTKNRTLKERIEEHLKKDSWCWSSPYMVEYIEDDFSRTDAEYIESHLINLYQTDKYYNRSKAKWGISRYISDLEDKWQYYDVINAHLLEKELEILKNRVKELDKQNSFYLEILNYIKTQDKQIKMFKHICMSN